MQAQPAICLQPPGGQATYTLHSPIKLTPVPPTARSQREVQRSACTASRVAWGLKVSAGYTMAAPLRGGRCQHKLAVKCMVAWELKVSAGYTMATPLQRGMMEHQSC